MKKRSSNGEKKHGVGEQMAIILLIILIAFDCLTPVALRGWNGTLKRSRIGLKVVDALGNLGIAKDAWDKKRAIDGGWLCPKQFHHNLTVFILPDLLRSTAGNENLASVSSAQELSLQDSDAIDFYWRQDIDAEKGLYPALWSPELQYERDVQLVTEKTLLQPSSSDHSFFGVSNQTDVLREFWSSQKEYFSLETPTYEYESNGQQEKEHGWQAEKAPMLFETAVESREQPDGGDNAYGGHEANEDLGLDWLNLTTGVPRSDVFLQADHIAHEDQACSDFDFFNTQNTPPVPMEWEAKEDGAVLERSQPDPLDGLLTGHEFDSLPTPDLQLAPYDIDRIFGDNQVAEDVAEAEATKETMLQQFPFVTADTFPWTSDAGAVQCATPMFEEDFTIVSEQSQVVIEALSGLEEPTPVSSAIWESESTGLATYPELPTESGSSEWTTTPTWNGDHDYVTDAYPNQPGAYAVSEWSVGEDRVKMEPGEEEDEEDSEYDSGMEPGRVASDRDELRARQLNLPFTAAEIVAMSQAEYVSLTRCRAGRLTREQIELVKEIRRHGGNKEAARRSRQRKVEMAKQLEDEVQVLEMERNMAVMEYRKAMREVEMEEKAVQDMKRYDGKS